MATVEDRKKIRRLDVNSTILLALASLAVAWCSFESTMWNGEQTFQLAEVSLQLRLSQKNAMLVAQQREIDATLTIEFVSAIIEKDKQRIDYYIGRSRSTVGEIFKKWLALDPVNNPAAPPHPLVMREYDALIDSLMAPSFAADRRAEDSWKGAQRANSISDRYILYTVIFNISVFLAAICGKTSQVRTSRVIMGLAVSIFVIALILTFFMPVRWTD